MHPTKRLHWTFRTLSDGTGLSQEELALAMAAAAAVAAVGTIVALVRAIDGALELDLPIPPKPAHK
jgi:hypothetical protein